MFAVALLAVVLAAPEETPAAVEQTDARVQAAAAVTRARALAADADYAAAIVAFEEALLLRPSAGLHYNIAVCHHRLLLSAPEDSPSHETHRAAAVAAYNAYLDAAPDAEDRYAVAATIQDLRGRPNVIDEWRIDDADPQRAALEFRSDEPAPAAAPPDAQKAPAAQAPTDAPPSTGPPLPPPRSDAPAVTPMRPGFPHGMLGLGFSVEGHAPAAISSTAGVESLPTLGPVFRGGGYLGDAREFLFGAELAYATQPTDASRGHRLSTFQMLLLTEWSRALRPASHLELGVGATLGLAGQTLRHAGPSPATCPVRPSGIVSTRGGAVLGGRFLLGVLLGTNRRHALTMRAGPTIAGMGGGTLDSDSSPDCVPSGQAPFAEYGMDSATLLIRADLGYAIRW